MHSILFSSSFLCLVRSILGIAKLRLDIKFPPLRNICSSIHVACKQSKDVMHNPELTTVHRPIVDKQLHTLDCKDSEHKVKIRMNV